jgi:hypothetical protein
MSKTVEDVTCCPLANRFGTLILDLRVDKAMRRTKSSDTKSSVATESTSSEISCPPPRVHTFISVRIKGRASMRLVIWAVASEDKCPSVAMEAIYSFGDTCPEVGISLVDGNRKNHNHRQLTKGVHAMDQGRQPHDESGLQTDRRFTNRVLARYSWYIFSCRVMVLNFANLGRTNTSIVVVGVVRLQLSKWHAIYYFANSQGRLKI